MSSSRELKRKKRARLVNNRKSFGDSLIQCNEKRDYRKKFDLMRKGYIEMGEINLQLAIDNESELVDINNYETWLCGV
ncbi:hypothetical protein NNC19_11030 [Clostridium sp. SHJSY1]|uniref:hypothetical protein n=1 Tax=Clostridium sp. SHJSY1 TaxID=2942483 RepID=UPI0028752FDA|nr:hypothetical protein [Clostridium sp. SHJSY1]MDS0526214.1 hypothetical protein [Clostridium sp. SHJSY1]